MMMPYEEEKHIDEVISVSWNLHTLIVHPPMHPSSTHTPDHIYKIIIFPSDHYFIISLNKATGLWSDVCVPAVSLTQ